MFARPALSRLTLLWAGSARCLPANKLLSAHVLTVRWGNDCWCQRTCSVMQLQLVIDSARSRCPERYSLDPPAHGGQLVGSGRQGAS